MKRKRPYAQSDLSRRVGEKETRKLNARRRIIPGIWAGFSTFGIVGWSIAAPTLIGAVAGFWVDEYYPSTHSWTLVFLIAGLILGCLLAWHWVSKENEKIQDNNQEDRHE